MRLAKNTLSAVSVFVIITFSISLSSPQDLNELKKQTVVNSPILLESIGAYNIVLYKGLFYGLPKSLGPVDWKGGKVGSLPGVVTAPTAKRARALIPDTQTPSKDKLEPLLNALTFIGIILIGILLVRFFIRLFVRRR